VKRTSTKPAPLAEQPEAVKSLLNPEVKARRQERDRKAREFTDKLFAERLARAELEQAGNAVEILGSEYELGLMNEVQYKPDEKTLRAWVKATADYKAMLEALREGEGTLLDRLNHAPAGVDPDAWDTARRIFLASDTNPEAAVATLIDVAAGDRGFALDIARYLRHEFPQAAEDGLTWSRTKRPMTQPASDGTSAETDEPKGLSQAEGEALVALLRLNATGRNCRVKGEQVRHKADPAANEQHYKEALASLVHKGLVGSKKATNGGYWLEPRGITLAKQLTTPDTNK
jgi:hypothetical protein